MKKPCVFQRDRKLKDILYRENYPLFAERRVRAEHLSVIFLWRLESIFFLLGYISCVHLIYCLPQIYSIQHNFCIMFIILIAKPLSDVH